VVWLAGKIRFVKKCIGNGQSRLPIPAAGFKVTAANEVLSESQESLGGNDGGRTIDRLPWVERVCRSLKVSA
jgi:hypothetical protein